MTSWWHPGTKHNTCKTCVPCSGTCSSMGCSSALAKFPGSATQRELSHFLGIVNYYHRFVPRCAVLCKPLRDILPSAKPSSEAVEWSAATASAFINIQTALKVAGVLDFPLPGTELWLCMDASDIGISAVLSFYSRMLKSAWTFGMCWPGKHHGGHSFKAVYQTGLFG
jgi:hypothetical protein